MAADPPEDATERLRSLTQLLEAKMEAVQRRSNSSCSLQTAFERTNSPFLDLAGLLSPTASPMFGSSPGSPNTNTPEKKKDLMQTRTCRGLGPDRPPRSERQKTWIPASKYETGDSEFSDVWEDLERLSKVGHSESFRYSADDVTSDIGTKRSPYADVNVGYIESLRHTPYLNTRPQIFRSVWAWQILANCGEILRPSEVTDETAEALFYSSARTSTIDCFISHSWSASWFAKWLAVLYYVNISTAVTGAISAWLCTCIYLLYRFDWTSSTLDEAEWVLRFTAQLLFLPVVVFHVLFFFGHWLPRPTTRYWLDRRCIHQKDPHLKAEGMNALLEIVSKSDSMLILWSEDYFKRLWCCAEVATFAVMNKGCDKIKFQALWLAPWVLTSMLTDCVCIVFMTVAVKLIPFTLHFWSGIFGAAHPLQVFLTQVTGIGSCLGIGYLPFALPNWIAFSVKIDSHEKMLAELSKFELNKAGSSVESDRWLVLEHVLKLFREMPDFGADPCEAMSPFQRFDNFMRTHFLEACRQMLGGSTSTPLTFLVVCMPMTFISVANVVHCNGCGCHGCAQSEESVSAGSLLLTNSMVWLWAMILVYPSSYPLALNAMHAARQRFSGKIQHLMSVLLIMCTYFAMGIATGTCGGLIVNAVNHGGIWLIGLVLWTAFLIHVHYRLCWQSEAPGETQHHIASYQTML